MNLTISRLALAALIGRKRFVLLLLFPLAMIAVTVLVRVLTSDPVAAQETLFGVGLLLMMPLLCLVAAAAVMGPEIDDGSIVYLLAKPVSRHAVAVSKYVVALAAALLLGPVPMLLTGLAVRPDDMGSTWAYSAGAAVSAIAYTSLFLALSTVLKNAVVAGLLFILLWEGVLAGLFSGVAWLSIGEWGNRVSSALDPEITLAGADITLWWAVAALAVVSLGGVWFAGDRLRSFSLKGDN